MSDDARIVPGDHVSHDVFGEGLVEEVKGRVATVRFAGMARKTILLSHLEPLQRARPARPRGDATALFDTYLMVDWSAGNGPKQGKDSIWYCLLEPDTSRLLMLNPATRSEAEQDLQALLRDLVNGGRRVLVGFDFPYGYPRGTAQRLAVEAADSWRVIWEELAELVEDGPTNRNNRFDVASDLNEVLTGAPGPFWGCPKAKAGPTLSPTKPRPWPKDIPEFRLCERLVGAAKSPWQLYGAGSVGSQALVGMPHLLALLTDQVLAPVSRVWPFETGVSGADVSADSGPLIVHAEIYPSLVPPSPFEETKDAAQVRAIAEHFAQLDDEGRLADLFDLSALPEDAQEHVVAEEGWILGARPEEEQGEE
jgi:hypothetical protein